MLQRTRPNKIAALHDMWVFADLINFKGGSDKFGAVHKELGAFLTAPQDFIRKWWGKPVDTEWLWDEYEKLVRRIVLMPRGHLKSTVSMLYVMWRLYRNPNIRFFFGTNKKTLAKKFVTELRQYFEDEELQSTMWNTRPHIKGPMVPALSAAGRRRAKSKDRDEDDTEALDAKIIWNNENLQFVRDTKDKEPNVTVVTVNTVATGEHYDIGVLDDIVDFKNSKTPELREDVNDWGGDLESVLEPKFKVWEYGDVFSKVVDVTGDEQILNGTRYFDGDFYDTTLESKEALMFRVFFRTVFVNGTDDAEGFIWPEGFGPREYRKVFIRHQERGLMRRFYAQYHNTIVGAEEQLLEYDKLTFVSNARFEKDKTRPGYAIIKPSREEEDAGAIPIEVKLFMTVDPAKSTKGDFSAIALGGYDYTGRLWLVDVRQGKWPPWELMHNLFDIVDNWDMAVLHLDSIGVGAYLPQVINEHALNHKKRLLHVTPYKGATIRKEERIERFLQPLLMNDKLVARQSVSNNVEFRHEMNMFPRGNHDDVLDAVAMLADVAFRTNQRKKKTRSRKRVGSSRSVNTRFGGTR